MSTSPIDHIDIEQVEHELEGALIVYDRMAKQLMSTLVIMGVIAIFCSLFVTSFAGTEWFTSMSVKIVSFVATLFLTLITAFGLSTKGNSTRTAWRHLNKARLLYNSGNSSIIDYIKAYEEAEAMLGGVDFTYQAPTKKQNGIGSGLDV